jgi:drug/metabolite transporter (DMT)-like permease
MIWFLSAFAGTLLWSIDNHIDKHVLVRYYKNVRPATPMLLSASICLIFALLILVFRGSFPVVPVKTAAIVMAAGAMYFAAAFPYYYALKKDEASRVVPLFQIQPIFAYILGAVFLNELLAANQLIGGLLIVAGAIFINLDLDNGFKLKKATLWLMMLSTFLFAFGLFLFKFEGQNLGFWPTAFYLYLGTALPGIVLLSYPSRLRGDLLKVLKKDGREVLKISLITESFNIIARSLFSYASLLAPLALVVLVNGFQPFIVLLIGIILTMFIPKLGNENISRKHLGQKVIAIITVFIGTYILYVK